MPNLSKLYDISFWFTQPTVILTRWDYAFGYLFLACIVLSLVLFFWRKAVRNEIKAKVLSRFYHLCLTAGFCGLIWYVFRYENTPIFALRYWVGIIILIAGIWKIFIWKYIIFNFRADLSEYEHEAVKNKYIPRSKR